MRTVKGEFSYVGNVDKMMDHTYDWRGGARAGVRIDTLGIYVVFYLICCTYVPPAEMLSGDGFAELVNARLENILYFDKIQDFAAAAVFSSNYSITHTGRSGYSFVSCHFPMPLPYSIHSGKSPWTD